MDGRKSFKQEINRIQSVYLLFLFISQFVCYNAAIEVSGMKRKSANPVNVIASDSIQNAVMQAVCDDSPIEGMLFELDVLENIDENMLDFVDCVFRKVQFAQIDVQRVHFSNCRFEQCDISGLPFRDGTLNRVEFIGCRGTGCNFDRMKIKDLLFQDCQMNYLTLAGCRMERVEFIDCDLTHAVLFENTQKDMELTRCRMVSAEFQGTSLKDVDLSSCELDGIVLQMDCLRGATIQFDQAPMILGTFGIKVKL